MTSFQAQLTKEWGLHRSLALDSVIAAVLGCLLLPLDGGLGVLLLGGLAAVRIGTRLGADLNEVDTWEFLLTRPIDRRAFVRERIALGLLPVFAVCAIVILCDALNAHTWFAHAFVAPAPWVDAPAAAIGQRSWFMLPVIFLLYVTGFERGLARGGTEKVRGAAFEAAVVGLFTAGAVAAITTIGWMQFLPRDDSGIHSTMTASVDLSHAALVAAAAIVAIGAFTWRRSELVVARKQIVAEEHRRGAGPATWVLVGLIVLGVLSLFVYSARGGTSASDAPASALGSGGK